MKYLNRPVGIPLCILAVLGTALSLFACRRPNSISISPIGDPKDQRPFTVDAIAVNKDEKFPTYELLFRPNEFLLQGKAANQFQCADVGTAVITVAVSSMPEIAKQVRVICRPADTIGNVPDGIVLRLGGGPYLLEPAAFWKGKAVSGAQIAITSSDPSVVKLELNRALPVRVGTTTLDLSIAGIDKTVSVAVGQTVLNERFRLADGRSSQWHLDQGHYDIEVGAFSEQEGDNSGVTLSWLGAVCANQPESQTFHFTCLTQRDTSMRLTNPVGFMAIFRERIPQGWIPPGATVSGSLIVTRIP